MTTHKFICPGGVLYTRITDVHHPLTVEMLRLLFRQSGDGDMICAFDRMVDRMYCVEAYVQFGSQWKAARARAALDGQSIYKGSCVLAIDLVPSSYTTITMPDGDEWTPTHFFDDTPYAEWDEALAVAELHNKASVSTSPTSASAVSTMPTNPVPVTAATRILVSSATSAAPASWGVVSLVASATTISASPGGDIGAVLATASVASAPAAMCDNADLTAASTMQSGANHVFETPITCSTMGPDHNLDGKDPMAEFMSSGSVHTFLCSSSEDSPSTPLKPCPGNDSMSDPDNGNLFLAEVPCSVLTVETCSSPSIFLQALQMTWDPGVKHKD
ncbi:hypothetical protein ZWY2020_040816 [Hordeum vulgare]|nr:hypothetical protein ZWY2020_040816 [Hordeum vulgare]